MRQHDFCRWGLAWLLLVLLSVVCARPLPASLQRRQSPTTQIIDTLQQSNLTKLANLLSANPAVLEQIIASPGAKTLLSPTDDALPFLPWVNVSEALLYHTLNGTVSTDYLTRLPEHTVLHSILASERATNLPGGNGQAVALSTGSREYLEYGQARPVVNEAINVDHLTISNGQAQSISVGDLTILPIDRVMTVPGNATFTIGTILGNAAFATLLDTFYPDVNSLRGVTIFVPSASAIAAFQAQSQTLTSQELTALVQNHVVANRVAYSPLLVSQGSLITTAGQDLHVARRNDSDDTLTLQVNVGNATAKIAQTDVMHRTGVVHTIDTVLFNVQQDAARAQQAAQSAANSANSFVAGPISAMNAASSQGTDVPPSLPGSASPLVANSTVTTTHDPSGGASASGSPLSPLTNAAVRTILHDASKPMLLVGVAVFFVVCASWNYI